MFASTSQTSLAVLQMQRDRTRPYGKTFAPHSFIKLRANVKPHSSPLITMAVTDTIKEATDSVKSAVGLGHGSSTPSGRS